MLYHTVNYVFNSLCVKPVKLTVIGLVSTTHINAKATPINDNNYNCHIAAVELVFISRHDPHMINFKKPGVHRLQANTHLFKIKSTW